MGAELRKRRGLLSARGGWAVSVLCLLLFSVPAGAAGRLATVSYADLIDGGTQVRTGETLRAALRNKRNRGVVQPFLAPYSALLPHALDLLTGVSGGAYRSAIEKYPAGSPQPAWVGILRGGRIHVVSDGKRRVRVFAPGDEPREALRRAYPVVRHCLAGLAPEDGQPLAVEVYAYRNSYERAELRLNLAPYAFESATFPPDRSPLNLAALEAFFGDGREIEGARLSRASGFGLVAGSNGSNGFRPTVADLAVAYRAAFHAGDNEAYVSLDPHPDPTRATVNFGGFLEDTRVGFAVLAADKRFKTVTTGIDPDTFSDLRPEIRSRVPSFLTSSERGAAAEGTPDAGKWLGVRLWFYPESIEVESDPGLRYALITGPYFSADAERQRRDFRSAAEFERMKRRALPAGVRQTIDHLNRNYEAYAAVFPEFGDLKGVARLMAVANWLRQAAPDWLDLDALLAVELPAVRTPREVTQLLAATRVPLAAGMKATERFVQLHATVTALTPVLDRSVGEWFKGPGDLGRFLRARRELSGTKGPDTEEPEAVFARFKDGPVRDLVRSRSDLLALVQVAAEGDGSQGGKVVLDVSGGVNMDGGSFRIRRTSASPALKAFEAKADAEAAREHRRAPGTAARGERSPAAPPALPAFLPPLPAPPAMQQARRSAPAPTAPGRGATAPVKGATRGAVSAKGPVVIRLQGRGAIGTAETETRVQGAVVAPDRIVFTRLPGP